MGKNTNGASADEENTSGHHTNGAAATALDMPEVVNRPISELIRDYLFSVKQGNVLTHDFKQECETALSHYKLLSEDELKKCLKHFEGFFSEFWLEERGKQAFITRLGNAPTIVLLVLHDVKGIKGELPKFLTKDTLEPELYQEIKRRVDAHIASNSTNIEPIVDRPLIDPNKWGLHSFYWFMSWSATASEAAYALFNYLSFYGSVNGLVKLFGYDLSDEAEVAVFFAAILFTFQDSLMNFSVAAKSDAHNLALAGATKSRPWSSKITIAMVYAIAIVMYSAGASTDGLAVSELLIKGDSEVAKVFKYIAFSVFLVLGEIYYLLMIPTTPGHDALIENIKHPVAFLEKFSNRFGLEVMKIVSSVVLYRSISFFTIMSLSMQSLTGLPENDSLVRGAAFTAFVASIIGNLLTRSLSVVRNTIKSDYQFIDEKELQKMPLPKKEFFQYFLKQLLIFVIPSFFLVNRSVTDSNLRDNLLGLGVSSALLVHAFLFASAASKKDVYLKDKKDVITQKKSAKSKADELLSDVERLKAIGSDDFQVTVTSAKEMTIDEINSILGQLQDLDFNVRKSLTWSRIIANFCSAFDRWVSFPFFVIGIAPLLDSIGIDLTIQQIFAITFLIGLSVFVGQIHQFRGAFEESQRAGDLALLLRAFQKQQKLNSEGHNGSNSLNDGNDEDNSTSAPLLSSQAHSGANYGGADGGQPLPDQAQKSFDARSVSYFWMIPYMSNLYEMFFAIKFTPFETSLADWRRILEQERQAVAAATAKVPLTDSVQNTVTATDLTNGKNPVVDLAADDDSDDDERFSIRKCCVIS